MNGFITEYVSKAIAFLQKISAVEIYKNFKAKKYSNSSQSAIIACKNNAIDTFIIVKWLLIIGVLILGINSLLVTVLIVYLLIMNIHTYMFYHLWKSDTHQSTNRDVIHMRRRFIALIQAFGFNCLSFSYFYSSSSIFRVQSDFAEKYTQKSMALMHSVYSSFTSGSQYIEPLGTFGFVIQVLHVVTTFIFLSILLSRVES